MQLTITSLILFVPKVRDLTVIPGVCDMLVPANLTAISDTLIVVTVELETLGSAARVPIHLGISESVESLSGRGGDG